jgi:hypothetical protein
VRAEPAHEPRPDGLLYREERRGEQDQERHELAEDALAREEQQQPAHETPGERRREEAAHAGPLAGQVALLRQGRSEVARGQCDRVRHVRDHRRQAERREGGEGDERAAPGERVDGARADGREPGQSEVEGREGAWLHLRLPR